jgi:hypothetical protein
MAGALAVIRYAKIHGTKHRPWLTALLARRPTKVAAIALANKITRMDVELLRKLSQRSIALDGGKRHLRLEGRCVVPARSSAHGLA